MKPYTDSFPDKGEIKRHIGSVPSTTDDEPGNAYKRCVTGAQYGARSVQANPGEAYVRKEDFVRTTTRKIKRQDNKLEDLK